MTAPTPWMTTDEVAAEIRMDREWVARQCAAKRLKATKVGQEWRIHRAALDAFMGLDTIPTPRPGRSRPKAKA